MDFLYNYNGRSARKQRLDNYCKLSVSRRTSNRYKKNLLIDYKDNVKSLQHSVLWFDNFSKFYKLSIPV